MKKFSLFTLGLAAALPLSAQTFSGGDGTQANPYQIASVADITELATQVNGGNNQQGKYFALTADITYASTDEFKPIGQSASTKSFNGTFDGKHHTIKGLTISGTSYQGFFGRVGATGVVKNITFDAPSFTITSSTGGVVVAYLNGGRVDSVTVKGATATSTGSSYKGGIVGFAAAGSVIEHSSFSGNVSTATSWGCIVGQNYGKVHYCWSDATVIGTGMSASTHLGGIASVMLQLSGDAPEITDCYFIGTIQGGPSNNVGGISGTLRKASIERSWNAGYLQGSGYAGGLVGTYSSGTIADCYNAGTIYNQSSEYVGGLVGYKDKGNTDAGGAIIENCLSLGTIFNAVLARHEGCEIAGTNIGEITLKNTYFDSQVAGWGSKDYGMTTRELTSGTALTGYGADVWQFTAGLYPRLKGTASLDVAVLNATPFYLAEGETHRKVLSNFTVSTANDVEWQITGTTQARLSGSNVTVTRGSSASNAVLHSYLGDYEKRSLVTIYPVIFSGTGTEADPYLIQNYDDLKKLSDATNNQELDFAGEFLKVTADIDMQHDTTFTPISSKSNYAFCGTLLGENHSIKNWTFNNVASQVLNTGLFGYVAEQGTVKNIIIDKSCQINAYRNFAPIVARLYGTVEGCKNYATVHTSAGFAGGIAYLVEGGTVRDCLNAGDIISDGGSGDLGGIANALYEGSQLIGCQNSGRIIAGFAKGSGLGGIVASNRGGTISDVLNTGAIIGSEELGGIVGEVSTNAVVTNALAVAPVIYSGSSETVGGAVGKNNTSAKYNNVVYDSQIAIYKSFEADGLEGRLTSDITTAKWAADSLWSHTAGTYPVLAKFAAEPVSILGAQPVTFAATDTRAQISADATLASVSGLTWKLTKGEKFSVSGSALKYAGSDGFVTDTLTATYAGYSKVIPISAIGNILPGSGTAQDPWIIATPADLVKVSTTVAATANSFDGKVFSIVNDLDMQGEAFTPIAGGDNKFMATLRGNGHKISNLNITSTDANTGLIGNLGMNGVVTDLTIASGTISGVNYVGAIAGKTDGTIAHVTNYASVTGTKGDVGGIAGALTTNASINDATNYGAVKGGSTYVGGIAGLADGQRALLSGLSNYGSVTGTGNVAGIFGRANATNITRVLNKGTITSTGNYVGGIVGYFQTSDSLTWAKNDGDVSGNSYVGGLVGQAYKSYSYSKEVRVADAYNYGTITSKSGAAGGIIGQSTAPEVERCANVGNVTNKKATVSSSSAGAGGIVGYGVPKITDCFNSGTITANNGVGQVLGAPSSTYTNYSFTRVVAVGTVEGFGSSAANIGAIQGKTSKHVTCTDVVYDKQMCNLAAIAKADHDGVTAALTTAITAPGDAWTQAEGRYPIINSLAQDTAVLLSSLPVKLDSADTRYAVTHFFYVAPADGCTWSGDEVFDFYGDMVNIMPNTVGDYNVFVSSGSYVHAVKLSVNAPNGSTSVTTVKTDVPVIATECYDLTGRRVPASARGIVIQVVRYADGTTTSRKLMK